MMRGKISITVSGLFVLVVLSTFVADTRPLYAGKLSQITAAQAKSQAANTSSARSASAAQTAAQAQRAQQTLNRSIQAITAMQAAQTAARNLSSTTANNVLNGISAATLSGQISGLVPDNGIQVATSTGSTTTYTISSSWSGVSSLSQTVSTGGSALVTVTQNQSQALLNWNSFNVGQDTTLYFDQTAGGSNVGNWVAFNKVGGASYAPSYILGKIQAPGQVYVLNQNGIIFGGSSQVNTHALVASALPINDSLIEQGILNNVDLQFLFSSLATSSGSGVFTSVTSAQALSNTTIAGNVIVEAGAIIEAVPISTGQMSVSTASGTLSTQLTLSSLVASGATLSVSYTTTGSNSAALSKGSDYILTTNATGQTVITLTELGLAKAVGGTVSATYTPVDSGGKVALIGLNVTNSGTIRTPQGQTILAAGQQVALLAHSTDDPTLRGLDVYIGRADSNVVNVVDSVSGTVTTASSPAGVAVNEGIIEIDQGSVTIAGSTVKQNGVISGTTSVALNGRVDLLANYNTVAMTLSGNVWAYRPRSLGDVQLGSFAAGGTTYGSITQILPDWSSNDAVVGSALALTSLINIQGANISMDANSLIWAPSASLPAGDSAVVPVDAYDMALAAGVSLSTGTWSGQYFQNATGDVILGENAWIDVAGSQNVAASVADNIVAVELRGTELADSPLLRDGALRGQTILIDIRDVGTYSGTFWIGTPLAETSGYINLIAHNVSQLTTQGGTVSIKAGGKVTMSSGSKVDVSGGWINYAGATIYTTKVMANGVIYDISDAKPNIEYDGILTNATEVHDKWGVTTTYANSLLQGTYEAGYTQGGDAGTVSITAASMALDGNLYGNAVAGENQRQQSVALSSKVKYDTTGTALPQYGTLNLKFENVDPVTFVAQSPNPVNVIISSNPGLSSSGTLVLSPDIVNTNGFSHLSITSYLGDITIASALTAQPGGSFSFAATNINVLSSLTAPGGEISLKAYNYSYYLGSIDPVLLPDVAYDSFSGNIVLAANASLNTAGLLASDNANASAPIVVDGGTVDLRASKVSLANGSTIDVSSGAHVSISGKQKFGNGGSILIATGADLNYGSLLGGGLELGANYDAGRGFLGYGGAGKKGGSINVTAPLIQVGGTEPVSSNSSYFGLYLDSSFFNQGGFSRFSFSGRGDPSRQSIPAVHIASGTAISPVVQSYVLNTNSASPTGYVLAPSLLASSLRSAANVSFTALGVTAASNSQLLIRGDLVMDDGATISLLPTGTATGSVALSGQTVGVLGDIHVPGGTISVKGGSTFTAVNITNDQLTHATPTVVIGADSVLSTKGVAVATPNATNLNAGVVWDGGTITLSGNIVSEAGSVLDVSGASGVFDVAAAVAGVKSTLAAPHVSTRIDSGGGSIVLDGKELLLVESTLKGSAGGSSASGGKLTVSARHYYPPNSPAIPSPADLSLLLTQSSMAQYTASGLALLGSIITDAGGNALSGGYFAADSLNGRGFDSLSLNGTVKYRGEITLSLPAHITIATNGVLYADTSVSNSTLVLNAAYVSLGTAFGEVMTGEEIATIPTLSNSVGAVYVNPFGQSSTYAGTLTVNATDLIDVGSLALQDIRVATLSATGTTTAGGDIRGNGTLNLAGDLYLNAGQIYPTTGAVFTIAAYGNSSSITIGSTNRGNAVPSLPLSAGGKLNIYAANITQGGSLLAPTGTINLGWDGSGTAPWNPLAGTSAAVPVTQNLVLTDGSYTSVSNIDRATGVAITLPYGTNDNGTTWIDPSGTNINTGGIATKSIQLSATNIDDADGSTIDVRGGGDLYSYRFVSGAGGTRAILSNSNSFAIIPGYAPKMAPVDTSVDSSGNLLSYSSSSLKVGDQIYLDGSTGVPAGVYTLLPAAYALMDGAYLVTMVNSSAVSSTAVTQSDGSALVAGYRFNGLNSSTTAKTTYATFEVASASVVKTRAQYDVYSANAFLAESAASADVATPRLPSDSGQLVLRATQQLSIYGSLLSTSLNSSGRGSQVDIASQNTIVINDTGTGALAGTLYLDAGTLSAFGADSLLIGGYRVTGTAGTTVTATTNELSLENTADALTGSDVILVSSASLAIGADVVVSASGTLSSPVDSLIIGGDGALLRVSVDPGASISRTATSTSTVPLISIGANAHINGPALILDSTGRTELASGANSPALEGSRISLNSGEISFVLENATNSGSGLILSNETLAKLQSAEYLSLKGYNAINFYGTGEIGSLTGLKNLALQTPLIRGDGQDVIVSAQNITLNNNTQNTRTASGAVVTGTGSLAFNANTISLGDNAIQPTATTNSAPLQAQHTLNVYGYTVLQMTASNAIQMQGTGALSVSGAFSTAAPLLTAATGTNQTIAASEAITLANPGGGTSTLAAASIGANLTFSGKTISVAQGTSIVAHSGNLNLLATGAAAGDGVQIDGTLDVSGLAQQFSDVTKYTPGGGITLASSTGSVVIGSSGVVSVAAAAISSSSSSYLGEAGTLTVSAVNGMFTNAGALLGHSGAGSNSGTFIADLGSLADTGALDAPLNAGGFTYRRDYRVRHGDVEMSLSGSGVIAHGYNLVADEGSITVSGKIDASGATGGTINLIAHNDLILSGVLTVKGVDFNAAGEGGSITLEAGSETSGTPGSGYVSLLTNSQIILSVDANTSPAAIAANQKLGKFNGTLHIRAPQLDSLGNVMTTASSSNAGGADLAVNPIYGAISNASSIVIEGWRLFDLTPASGTTSATISAAQMASTSSVFWASANTFVGNSAAILNRIWNGNTSNNSSSMVITPGVELTNRNGDINIGNSTWSATNDWSLASWRFGSQAAPGVLTIRAAGNINFFNSLSDGFTSATYTSSVLTANAALPLNQQSWTYRIAAGADFTGANYGAVLPVASLSSLSGSIKIGAGAALPTTTVSSSTISRYFQVIRTGTGDIDLTAANDVLLLSSLASIYTSGVALTTAEATSIYSADDFEMPNLLYANNTNLGSSQTTTSAYNVQYTLAGGNVTVTAGNDIKHALTVSGQLVDDSSKEMPTSWLFRRGFTTTDANGNIVFSYTHSYSGSFGAGEIASTSWWINFSTFFEGIGSLGGGNVSLLAGHDIKNVDAVVATNARTTKVTTTGDTIAAHQSTVELGGGDLSVRSGNDINGGVYYVERGKGTLDAGHSILTNITRAAADLGATASGQINNSYSWLPTTLFLGKGSFDVSARGDLLLGPVANPFLLPQAVTNSYYEKTYFSTYASTSSVTLSSDTGDITIRNYADPIGDGSLYAWYNNVMLYFGNSSSSSGGYATYQSWLKLAETNLIGFQSVMKLMPGTLKATAFDGDINIVGNVTLSPSAEGTIDLLASGSINGLQPNTVDLTFQQVLWGAATINLSDADPSAIPDVTDPLSYDAVATSSVQSNRWSLTNTLSLAVVSDHFAESGAANRTITQNNLLHAPGLLHATDTTPVHLYANSGDISGMTLYSPKSAYIIAGQDITDVAFYIQNVHANDISIVSAGRDIILYNLDSKLMRQAVAASEQFNLNTVLARPGDLQIGGPGTLEVLAGRNLDLGDGPNDGDGTGMGIVSIGNLRNPFLPGMGADLIVGAGIGNYTGGIGATSEVDFSSFVDLFLSGGGTYASQYIAELKSRLAGYDSTLDLSSDSAVYAAYAGLSESQQNAIAMDIFFLALRDSGRDSGSAYQMGYAAIGALFPGAEKASATGNWSGDISLTSREIKTENGGNVSLLIPNGSLTVGYNVEGTQAQDQGIFTVRGGTINIFAHDNIDVGTSRIFTLSGGDIVIWSSFGDIAAGASSKTVQSAPPTRVLLDVQSANVQTDLAGLATGGGIGVLQSVAGATTGNVDLVAPVGTVDAGDAGIRVSGSLNIAAQSVLNAANIQAVGGAAGVPTVAVSAPNIGSLTTTQNAAAATNTAAADTAKQNRGTQSGAQSLPSIITVEVVGYGGDDEQSAQ